MSYSDNENRKKHVLCQVVVKDNDAKIVPIIVKKKLNVTR